MVLYPTACAEIRYLSYITEVSMGYADIGKFACSDQMLRDGSVERTYYKSLLL
jgi:hypothetical protein